MTQMPAVEKILWMKPGKGIAASGQIPEDAEFFKDHFPGFPVLPGVLALEMLKQTGECYLRKQLSLSQKRRFSLKTIKGVKFSKFLKPGDAWESRLELVSSEGNQTRWNARLTSGGAVAVSARLVLEQTEVPENLMVR